MIADLVQLYKVRKIELPEIIQNIVDRGPITNLEEISSSNNDTIIDYTPFDFDQITSNIKIIKPKKLLIKKNKDVKTFEKIENDYIGYVIELLEKLSKSQSKITVMSQTFKTKKLFDGNTPNILKNKDVTSLEKITSEKNLDETSLEKPSIVANLLEKSSPKRDYLYFWENSEFEAKEFKIPRTAPFFKKDGGTFPLSLPAVSVSSALSLLNANGFSFEMDEKDTSINILSKLAKMPDFMTNKYTAVLVPSTNRLGNNFLNPLKEFCFRLEGIEIPQSKRAAFETKFLNTSIKRLEPIVETKRSGSLNLRLDEEGRLEKLLKGFEEQNTYFPKSYNTKVGDFTSDQEGLAPQTEEIASNSSGVNKEIHTSRKVVKSLDWTLLVFQPVISETGAFEYFHFPKDQNCPISDYTPGLNPDSFSSSPALDLSAFSLGGLSPMLNPGAFPPLPTSGLPAFDLGGLSSMLMPKGITGKVFFNVFTFSNVRFLGQTQALQYKADGANTLNGSFKFIYRKVETTQLKKIINPFLSNPLAGILT